jgi:hypothetical protein
MAHAGSGTLLTTALFHYRDLRHVPFCFGYNSFFFDHAIPHYTPGAEKRDRFLL